MTAETLAYRAGGALVAAAMAKSDPWDDAPPPASEDDYGARRDAFDL